MSNSTPRLRPAAHLVAGLSLASLVALAAAGCGVAGPGAPSVRADATRPAACGSAPAHGGAEDASRVVAELGDAQLTLGELDRRAGGRAAKLRAQLQKDLYDLRREALDSWVEEHLIARAAKARGLSPEALVQAEVDAKAPAPTDAEAKAFFEQNRERLPGVSFEEVRGRLVDFMTDRRREARRAEWMEALRAAAGVKTHLPRFRVAVEAKGPVRGPADAPVTIVAYSDFQCPFCGRAEATVQEVWSHYPGKIRLVFRHFPLPFHEHARPAAAAAVCAAEQGKFWPMHDALFAHQRALGDADVLGYAAAIAGLDVDAFKGCLASPRPKAIIDADVAAGEALGVNGTPAFFINGVELSGAQPFPRWQAIIDEELAR